MQELVDLEAQGWKALSSKGDAGEKFYGAVLRDDAVMLFPGGMRLDGKEAILESFSTQPWERCAIQDPLVIPLSENAAALVYRVTAQRQDSDPYVALISSIYAMESGA